MKAIIVFAIMKVRGVTTFYISTNKDDNGSKDGNDDASDDETNYQSIGEIDVESDDDRER